MVAATLRQRVENLCDDIRVRSVPIEVKMSKLPALVLSLAFAMSCSPSHAQAESWKDSTKEGEVSLQADRISEAFKYFKAALADVEKQKVPATDPLFRTLLLEDIPNLVERLSLEKSYERAEELANAKLDCTQHLYGERAPLVLDGLQDLQSLYSTQSRSEEMIDVLKRYAKTVTTLRNEGRDIEIAEVEQYRKLRLNRKLKESFERIQKRFVPVNKAMQSTDESVPSKESTR